MPLLSSTSKIKKTPSFVCEIPLEVKAGEALVLDAAFDVSRQLRVFLYRIGLWSLLSTLRLIYSYQSKRPHEAEFRFLANFQGQEGLLIDVGANAGQSGMS